MAATRPPLAGMDASAANLHQFVTFLARQHLQRDAELAAEAAAPPSLKAARKLAAPGWSLTFEQLAGLMEHNDRFRACEEIVGALSDPTTDIGLRGLDNAQYEATLAWVTKCMEASIARIMPAMLRARDADFQHMTADDQYEMAGAHAVLYLIAQLKNDAAGQTKWLTEARKHNVLAPEHTPLKKAITQQEAIYTQQLQAKITQYKKA